MELKTSAEWYEEFKDMFIILHMEGWTERGLFKDGVTKELSDTRRYMALGNSVTTNVIKRIGEKLTNGVYEGRASSEAHGCTETLSSEIWGKISQD